MTSKNAYWFKYRKPQKEDSYLAIVAETLDEAFKMIMVQYDVPNEDIFYLNRELEVLLPF
ncbi:hypothetical protein H2O64_04635 [Kordia sp. YSTF-M3]|uniref:Uncharacterized protein n=1 Tax=Kordia aestuariivivens TaxID=2759037 RepID=A0ABR7Q5X6_9FLAO|nr:hypothetical protein [Kordia aestuariivivens]MBC8753945.1 hypothetical protein [Kordia aestuariivivens]